MEKEQEEMEKDTCPCSCSWFGGCLVLSPCRPESPTCAHLSTLFQHTALTQQAPSAKYVAWYVDAGCPGERTTFASPAASPAAARTAPIISGSLPATHPGQTSCSTPIPTAFAAARQRR